ncbi:MAG: ATP cone domain-containing protein [Nanoarchaeota archaeon]
MKKTVIKRKGSEEEYEEKKIYASCYAAALDAHYSEKEAEKLALEVTDKINAWIKSKKQVTSSEIRHQMIITIPDSAVALLYKHHLDAN